jgi:hypothetical protein
VETQIASAFTSILSIREALDHSIKDIKNTFGNGQEGRAEQIDFLVFSARKAPLSNAKILQDLWVLYETNQKRNGFFVDVCVQDDTTTSNTLLLETVFGWQGVVAAPALSRSGELPAGRACYVADKFVVGEDATTPPSSPVTSDGSLTERSPYSSLALDGATDAETRAEAETISLSGLLREAGAPEVIDYLSLDAGDATLPILKELDFGRHVVRLLSITHNYGLSRGSVHELLTHRGYRRKFESFSAFDDWYVKVDRDRIAPPSAA